MNKKGFAISGMLYTILLIFVTLLIMLLYNLQNRKTILDELKIDVVEANEQQAIIDALAAQLVSVQTDFIDKRTWKKLGNTVTGTTPISLPNDYNELHIIVRYQSSITYSFDIIKIDLTSSAQDFRAGHHATATGFGSAIITATTSSVNLINLYKEGTNYTATSTIDVYYR